MQAFRLSRFFAILLTLFVVIAGSEVLAQGKGKGRGGDGQRGGGDRMDRGIRGGDQGRGRGKQIQQQPQAQHRVIPQNRGNDRRVQMQQRTQEVQQQRQQQAQQQQVIQKNSGNDRRILMQQRMQQIQQQRQQQAQQQVFQQNRGNDRRVRMQQRMQQIQQQAQQRVFQQNRGNDRRIQMQQMQQQRMQQAQQRQVPAWAGRRGEDRRANARDRRGSIQPQIIPQQKMRDWFRQADAGRRNDRQGRSDRRRDRSVIVQRQTPIFSGVWPQNYGQQRRAEVHQRNAARRAWRDRRSWAYTSPTLIWQQQAYIPTRRARTFYDNYVDNYVDRPRYSGQNLYDRYSYGPSVSRYYDDGYSEPYNGSDRADQPRAAGFFRNLIFAVLGGGVSEYDDYSNYGPSFASANYGAYSPRHIGYNRGAYNPVGNAYVTDPYNYDPYFYDDPEYSEVLPIQHFISDAPGGGLFRQLFTQLLAIGYDQGYQDGVVARRIRERDRVFYDPYVYDNAAYDPYSVSLGDNRRCLSQGYELGYQDAIDRRGGYDQFQDGGVDLVSVLIGTVSQLM